VAPKGNRPIEHSVLWKCLFNFTIALEKYIIEILKSELNFKDIKHEKLGDIGFDGDFPGYYDGRLQEGRVRNFHPMRRTCCAL
jgi:hypothetical protein